ncbi:MAG: hypothetical protein ACTSO3_16170, partial [Candidatus Heimdallarchaeaceae archaeon]
MKTYIFCVLIIFIATATQGQDFTTSNAERATFLNNAFSLLSIKAQPEQLQNIQTQMAKWQNTNAEEDWIKVTDAVYKAAKSSDSKSDVTIATSCGNGATVKYQTLGQR